MNPSLYQPICEIRAIPAARPDFYNRGAMELGHHYLQLSMSLALILTAAVVAFICDMLKRNNEQLREMNIELQIRQEEEQRRAQVPAPRLAEKAQVPKPEKAASPQPVPAHVAAPMERSMVSKERKRTVNSEALAAMERGAALAGSGGRPRSASDRKSVV